MKVKGLLFVDVVAIQETVTDELKKVQKEEISTAFQILYYRAKACIYAKEPILILKNIVFLTCLGFFKKISPKNLDHTVYVTNGSLLRAFRMTSCFVAL
jgi:hypothetical protein